ncbi:MAG: histidine kinase dimerization/phospho-acceptor domain-containing protein [Sphingomicrobium sp.]
MRFDDRLLTVLNQPVGTPHDKAVRWRQLVDLVARSGPGDDSPSLAQALEEIRAGAGAVDEQLRAAAARAIAALPVPLGLLEIFARDNLAVSAPVLAAASLDNADWQTLIAGVDVETRRFIEAIHPGIAATPSASYTDALVEAHPAEHETQGDGMARVASRPSGRSLADVVARIERRRKRRDSARREAGSAGGAAHLARFRWECGPSGDIQWVDGAPRGALIGRSIANPRAAVGEGADTEVARAFALRSPFRDASFTISGDGAMAGEWMMSGVPAFEPADGRFAGYRGMAQRRDLPMDETAGPALAAIGDPASLRELVHEIKTPLNAIIGFAEIIDGQYLGPADRPYRQRAAHIVGQARILLDAIDDVDFAAKAHSAQGSPQTPTALGSVLEALLPELRERAEERAIDLDFAPAAGAIEVSVSAQVAERIIRRTMLAMIEAGADGERLRLSIERAGERYRVAISRPQALRSLSVEQLFGIGGDHAAGLSLRLARSLARIAGVGLVAGERDISLVFQRA